MYRIVTVYLLIKSYVIISLHFISGRGVYSLEYRRHSQSPNLCRCLIHVTLAIWLHALWLGASNTIKLAVKRSDIWAFDWNQNRWPWIILNGVMTADSRYLSAVDELLVTVLTAVLRRSAYRMQTFWSGRTVFHYFQSRAHSSRPVCRGGGYGGCNPPP